MKIYFFVVSFLAFITFSLDKYYAVKQKPRIRETTLLFITLIGGTLGSLLAMNLFRHKTIKNSFQIKLWIIITCQIFLAIWLLYY